MTTVRCLLDSLGTPPAELCLDWAWQIEQLVDGCMDESLDWSQLQVNEVGELQRLSNTTHPNISAGHSRALELIEQLMAWSGQPHSADQLAERHSRQSLLSESTLRGLPAADSGKVGKRTRGKIGTAVPLAAPQPVQQFAATPKPAASRRRGHRRTFAGTVVGLSAIGLAAWGLGVFGESTSDLPTVSSNFESESPQAGSVRNQSPPAAKSVADTRPAVEQTLQTLTQPMAAETALPTGAPASPAAVIDQLASAGTKSPTTHTPVTPMVEVEETQLPILPGRLPASSAAVAAVPTADESSEIPIEEVDVLAEMERVTKSAATAEDVHELPADQSDEVSQPPLMLSTFPMLQLQQPPAQLAVRVRQPAWHLRLDAGDGFRVLPRESQVLEGRDLARWIISDEEAVEPATQFVVLAQLKPGRVPAIRWRIGATAQDLPPVFVPLDPKFLMALQQSLQHLTYRLHSGVEYLRAVGKSSGLPSELRSSLSAQRRHVESQLELGTRLLTVVAEAQQLDGWLDSQLEVHARLVDAAQVESTPLLQFGTWPPASAAPLSAEPGATPATVGELPGEPGE